MESINNYRVKIEVDLPNGVYIFNNASATGKTRLLKLLKQYRTAGERVSGYTYEDKQAGVPVNSCFSNKPRIVLFDRYDMYYGFANEEI